MRTFHTFIWNYVHLIYVYFQVDLEGGLPPRLNGMTLQTILFEDSDIIIDHMLRFPAGETHSCSFSLEVNIA